MFPGTCSSLRCSELQIGRLSLPWHSTSSSPLKHSIQLTNLADLSPIINYSDLPRSYYPIWPITASPRISLRHLYVSTCDQCRRGHRNPIIVRRKDRPPRMIDKEARAIGQVSNHPKTRCEFLYRMMRRFRTWGAQNTPHLSMHGDLQALTTNSLSSCWFFGSLCLFVCYILLFQGFSLRSLRDSFEKSDVSICIENESFVPPRSKYEKAQYIFLLRPTPLWSSTPIGLLRFPIPWLCTSEYQS